MKIIDLYFPLITNESKCNLMTQLLLKLLIMIETPYGDAYDHSGHCGVQDTVLFKRLNIHVLKHGNYWGRGNSG